MLNLDPQLSLSAIMVGLTSVASCLTIRFIYRDFLQGLSQRIEQHTEQSLAEFLIYLPPRQFWLLLSIAMLPLSLLLGLLLGTGVMVMAVIGLVVSLPLCRRWLHKRRCQRIGAQLPDALILLANSMSAGLSLPAALELSSRQTPSPLRAEFYLLVRRVKLGDPLGVALQDFNRRVPIKGVRQLVLALTLGLQHGAQQVAVLGRLAHALQQQWYAEERLHSLSAQARLQGKVMVLLPFGLFLALHWLHPENTNLLVATKPGQVILLISATLMVIGHLLVRRIMRAADDE